MFLIDYDNYNVSQNNNSIHIWSIRNKSQKLKEGENQVSAHKLLIDYLVTVH